MGYDSLTNRVGDYIKKKQSLDEEDSILSWDEFKLQDSAQSMLTLDADLQDKIIAIQNEYMVERGELDRKREELDSDKQSLLEIVEGELKKVNIAKNKIDGVIGNKYAKNADKAAKKCDEYIGQLEGLIDQLGEAVKSTTTFDNNMYATADSTCFLSDLYSMDGNSNDDNPVFGNTSNNILFGNGEFVPLLTTNQTIHTINIDGKLMDVFDHPFELNSYRICNQGSAYPKGPQGTCGCCSCGTIINKSGGRTSEHDVVAYAWNKKLCSDSGETSPDSWVGILGGAGISASVTTGASLEELAVKVESGHGVIIGVSACTYCPQLYGRYLPGAADGHALVVESVVRDHATSQIIEYIVSDSNGRDTKDACHRVPAKIMKKAFKRKQKASVVTDEVIW